MSPRHLLYAVHQSVVTVAFRVAALTFTLLNNLQDRHLECFIWIQWALEVFILENEALWGCSSGFKEVGLISTAY